MLKVLLYGPLSQEVAGGFDRMNNNTFDLFTDDGEIEIFKMPMLKMKFNGLLKVISYPLFYIISLFHALAMLISYKITKRPDILHITAVTTFLYRDVIVLYLAKLLNIKIVYDIRAGMFINNYQDPIKRVFYQLCFKIASSILVEGKTYQTFLQNLGYQSIYFPNYTSIEENKENKPYYFPKKLRFVYFGRIVKEKGIEDALEILKSLVEKYNIALEFIIGGKYSKAYYQFLHHKFGNFMTNVIFTGYLNKRSIDKFLITADFFMFLSSWAGEGHSNSLNEAMGCGLPIFFYDQGFTRDIINNDDFLLNTIVHNGITDEKLVMANVDKMYGLISNGNYINYERERLKTLVLDKYSLNNMKPVLKSIYMAKG